MSQPATSKRLLYLVRRAPYSGQGSLELLDSLLVGAAFEQQVSVLFIDDGVWQLLPGPGHQSGGLKDLAQQWRVLPEYDVDAVYVCAESLARRHLDAAALCLPVQALDLAAQRALLAAQEVVFND